MKTINFVVWKENDEFVSQCLNVDVASHGKSLEDAIKNLKEAVELYCQDESDSDISEVEFKNARGCSCKHPLANPHAQRASPFESRGSDIVLLAQNSPDRITPSNVLAPAAIAARRCEL